jgi:DNA-binding transcriptional ArsR family regulator
MTAGAVLARFFRALGDPNRLALFAFIAGAGRTGTECVRHLGLAQSRVPAHLACLVTCGLVEAQRDVRFTRYTVRDERALELVRLAAAVAACTRAGAP